MQSSTCEQPVSRRHLPALDGVRGVAILLVMWVHFAPVWIPKPSGPGQQFLHNVLNGGWAGVDLFFVLSGFLITGILLDTKGDARYFRNFYARRTLRIFPLYYLALGATLVLVGGFGDPHQIRLLHQRQIWLWTYASNILVARQGWAFDFGGISLNHFWTLAVEEQFYLIWPAVVFLVDRATLKKGCIAAIAASLLLRGWFVYGGHNTFAAFALMPCRIDAFAIGALAAMRLRETGAPPVRAAWILLVVSTVLLIPAFFEADWIQVPGRTLLAMFSAGLILAAVGSPWRVFFAHPLLTIFGRYSYALYVIHVPVNAALRLWLPTERYGVVLHVAAGVAVSLAGAYASWHLVEKHFLPMKRWFQPGTHMPHGCLRIESCA